MAFAAAAYGPKTTAGKDPPLPRLLFTSSAPSGDVSDASPLPSFAEFVVSSWGCTKEQGENYDKALALAETNLFGHLDEEAVDASNTSPLCPLAPTSLSACPSSASSVKDDEDPERPKPPLIEHLDDLAAEYFGRNWDRVDELVRVNQERLEAWKAARAFQKNEQQQGQEHEQHGKDHGVEGSWPGLATFSSSSLSCARESVTHQQQSQKRHSLLETTEGATTEGKESEAATPAAAEEAKSGNRSCTQEGSRYPPSSSEPALGSVIEINEGGIDLLLSGLPGPAVQNGRQTTIPNLEQAELILLEVHSDHCPACRRLAPSLATAAAHYRDNPSVLFVTVNGPENPAFLERLDVQWFPTLKVIHRKSNMLWDWPPLPVGGLESEEIIKRMGEWLAQPSSLSASGVDGVLMDQQGYYEDGEKGRDGGEGGEDGEGRGEGGASRAAAAVGPPPGVSNDDEDQAKEGEGDTKRVEKNGAATPSPPHSTSSTFPPSLPFLQKRKPSSSSPCAKPPKKTHLDTILNRPPGAAAADAAAVASQVPHDDQPPSFDQISQLHTELSCRRDLASRRKWMVSQTEFWRKHGQHVVSVEADHFKAIDPVYQLLTRAKLPKASEQVHNYSTQAAEELFLSALKFRRDIIFDSTLAWAPFLMQTLDMVRDNRHTYKRGPGYVETPSPPPSTGSNNGSISGENGKEGGSSSMVVEERYWAIETTLPRDQQVTPYRVELVGVFVRPEVAVRRAIIRRLLTGRGVPVRDQLRSHALFAKNFEKFSMTFDTVTLYDNNRRHDRVPGRGGGRGSGRGGGNEEERLVGSRVIARKDVEDTELKILDVEAFRAFQAVARINTDATSVDELYEERRMERGDGEERVVE
ncbi:p-loop containing nucleoside triphosphate hydrolases superfamily protein [Nannochloropsis oceanica]